MSDEFIGYESLFNLLEQEGFSDWVVELRQADQHWFTSRHHGDFKRWNAALQRLPEIKVSRRHLSTPAVGVEGTCLQPEVLSEALTFLRPWRKGPYRIAELSIDTEWRSDFKWNRVLPHISPLKGRKILDVGCGNGYHAWRMLNEDPQLVIGIDPSVLFNMQFRAINHYMQDRRIHLLPLTVQQMPARMEWFDTVFSMGILYHRRSPIDHLMQLKDLLKADGEVCLETLVIEGGGGQVLVPESRYARMNNVWFLPSVKELLNWFRRCGFRQSRVVDVNRTSVEEQRRTEWMPFESLSECLDAGNPEFTVEGYPAPLRAVIIARK